MIDLNQQGDSSGDFGFDQIVPGTMQIFQNAAVDVSAAQVQDTSCRGPDTMEVAIAYRLRTNHVGMAAEFLGEAGIPLKNGHLVNCACCGKPETPKKTLICDACGQSFHLKCMKLRESHASDMDEWVCMACAAKQEKQKWVLGRIESKQEVVGTAEVKDGGGMIGVQQPKDGNVDGVSVCKSKFEDDGGMVVTQHSAPADSGIPSGGSQRERIKRQKRDRDDDFDASVVTSKKTLGASSNSGPDEPKTRITRLKTLCRSKEDVQNSEKTDVDYVSAGDRDSSQTSLSAFSKDLDDDMEASSRDAHSARLGQQQLKKLKEFIAQQGGSLEDDWRVDVKKRTNSEKAFDVMFFSPDRQKFRSRLEVARFLGLFENRKGDANVREWCTPVARGRKRKEVSRVQKLEDLSEEMEQSEEESLELAKRRKMEAHSLSEAQDPVPNLELQLPLQCMDLRVEALGIVELRPGYYNDNFVWPVGYRCSWHDGVTGSICISEVIDGGPLPPIFRVTRKSCFAFSEMCIDGKSPSQDPLQKLEESGKEYQQNSIDQNCQGAVERGVRSHLQSNHVYDEDDELSMLLGTLTSFTDGDLFEPTAEDEGWNFSDDGRYDTQPHLSQEVVGNGSTTVDRASAHIKSVNTEDAFPNLNSGNCVGSLEGKADEIGEIVVESSSSGGAWRLLAEQVLNRVMELFEKGTLQLGCKHVGTSMLSSLGLCVPDGMEGSIQGNTQDAQNLYSKLQEWVGQDRFGFDIPVIQKYFEAKKAKLLLVRPPPPSGWPICQKVSAKFVGDLLQIWEFLCRFSDILGQKEPPSLEELEEIVADTLETDIENRIDTAYKKVFMLTTGKCVDQTSSVPQHASEMVKGASLEGLDLQAKKVGSTSSIDQHLLGSKRLSKSKSFTSPGCYSIALAASNIALLKIALSDLQQMALAGGPDLTLDSKRGKKKEGESAVALKKQAGTLLPLNELTWPEVARRYVIGLLTLITCGENIDISVQERRKILRCIQGDGGVLCGALDGVAAIEADALLLAEAEKQLSRWLQGADHKSISEPSHKDGVVGKPPDEMPSGGFFRKPSWAIVLEPVRKLATNVGARIRNCVREALEMNPPDWARETLEWSISKDVYKGNASGPTKRAVLSVLEKVANEKQVSPPKVEKRVEYVAPTPGLVMKRCRVVLRQIITADDVRVFCNSLGGTVLGYFEKEDDNIEVPLPLVTRPLDFRMIDSRLATGSYGDSHESYAADMRQLFQNVPVVFYNREGLIKVGQELSQRFERLYEEKVMTLVNGKEEVAGLKETDQVLAIEEKDVATEVKDVTTSTGLDEELKKAPWEEGVCKICGIDKDDDSTLLCDGCDAEYHIYCLEPPLSIIPEGNWYCPSCVAHEQGDSSHVPTAAETSRTVFNQLHQSRLSEDGSILPSLVASMAGKDYWQLSGLERVHLLKFLCDKVLESTHIRDHIDQSMEALPELQQRLRLLLIERQTRVSKGSHRMDDILAADNTEVGNKEAFLPKKRGRKSLKASTPCLVMEESTRSESGIEDLKIQADRSSGYEIDATLDLFEGRANERFFQNESETSAAMHLRDGEAEQQEPGKNKGSLGQTIHDAQMNSRPSEDFRKGKFDVPQLGTAEALRYFGEEMNKVGAPFVPENALQKKNGNAQVHEAVISKSSGVMHGNVAELQHPLNHSMMKTMTYSVDSPAAEEQEKGSNGVLQGWSLEVRTEKGPLPLTSSYLQHGSEHEASPLFGVQAIPVQTAMELLEAEIEKVETELMKTAPRRECLGRDDLGRTYWALGWAGKFPWLVVETMSSRPTDPSSKRDPVSDGNADIASCNQPMYTFSTQGKRESTGLNASGALLSVMTQPGVQEWSAYYSDECIEQLIRWLKPTITTERNLKSVLTKWCLVWSHKYTKEVDKQRMLKSKSVAYVSMNTKAATILAKKFGPISQPGPGEVPSRKRGRKKKSLVEGKIFRCDCLELVWATRVHCPCCHHTYDTVTELQGHNNGACSWMGLEDEGQGSALSKAKKAKNKGQEFHPPDLSLVVKRFTVRSSNRERVLQIGCLADKGPRFVPALSVSPLLDPSLHIASSSSLSGDQLSDITNLGTRLCSSSSDVANDKTKAATNGTLAPVIVGIDEGAGYKEHRSADPISHVGGSSGKPSSSHASKDSTSESLEQGNAIGGSKASDKNTEVLTAKMNQGLAALLPPSQPLVERNMWAFKKLKASLLDIESMLSIDVMEPSRSEPNRRRAWRSFVKSAASILELVQSLTLLEQMVKADCFRETWCNWTSLSAGVGINTICSLALRIYSLDAAIKYKRSSVDLETEDSDKPSKAGRKKKT